jgi:hypothetical protein
MLNILDNFSALHNFKVMNGLYKDGGSSCTGYLMERKIQRIIKEEMNNPQSRDALRAITTKTDRYISAQINRLLARIHRIPEDRLQDYYDEIVDEPLKTILRIYKCECVKKRHSYI